MKKAGLLIKNKIRNKKNKSKDKILQLSLQVSKDAWRSCKEWLNKTKKIESITIINIIGKKDKNWISKKEFFYQFGDLVIKRRRNMLLRFVGVLNILICLLFHLVVMTLQNKKLDKYLFGLLKMFLIHNTYLLVTQELCA